MKKRDVSVEFLGCHGYGTTKTEAKAHAMQLITTAMTQRYTPRLFQFRGWTGIVWAEPCVMCTAVFQPNSLPNGEVRSCAVTDYKWQEAEDSLRLHLAQLAWDEVEEESPFITNPDKQNDFRKWVKFQKAYREAKAKGYSEEECHSIAWGSR